MVSYSYHHDWVKYKCWENVQDFIPTLAFVTYTFIFPVKIGRSKDKILLAFVFYPVMMVAIANH